MSVKVMNKNRRVILHGYYGNKNLGDDAILLATKAIFEYLPHVDLRVLGHTPHLMNTIVGKKIARLPYGRTLLYKYHFKKMKEQVDKADALILGGGGILHDRKSRDATKDVRLLLHMQSKRKPTMIYAVGVAGFWREKSKRLVKQAVENAQYLSCRDPASAKRIRNLGVTTPIEVTGDPSIKIPKLLGLNPDARQFDVQQMKVYVSLRRYYVTAQMIKALTKLVQFLVNRYNAKVDLVPLRTAWFDDDRVALNRLYDQSDRSYRQSISLVRRRPLVQEFTKNLASTSMMIGMKLHSIILASSMGVPCIALSYKQDVTDFMRYIKAERYALSLAEACDGSLLIEKTEELLASYTTVSKQLLQNIKKIEEKTLLDEKAIKNISGEINFERSKTSQQIHKVV